MVDEKEESLLIALASHELEFQKGRPRTINHKAAMIEARSKRQEKSQIGVPNKFAWSEKLV